MRFMSAVDGRLTGIREESECENGSLRGSTSEIDSERIGGTIV
jgi:hypothetical protein